MECVERFENVLNPKQKEFKNVPFEQLVSKFSHKDWQLLDVLVSSNEAKHQNKYQKGFIKQCFVKRDDDIKIDKLYAGNVKDVYSIHFNYSLAPSHIQNLLTTPVNSEISILFWPRLGRLVVNIPKLNKEEKKTVKREISKFYKGYSKYGCQGHEPVITTLDKLGNSILIKNINRNRPCDNDNILTDFQIELFSIISNYQDLFYPQQNNENTEDVRVIYCLHVLNHIIKNHSEIYLNNCKIASNFKHNHDITSIITDDKYKHRDQGLVRPKVLLLLPFRSSALKVIEVMIGLLYGQKSGFCKANGTIKNLKRFLDEFGGNTVQFPKRNPKPDDYTKIFSGNTNDNFKIGMCLTNRSLRLYTDFYSSDVIIASPLGIRTMIGAPGDSIRDFDFLNSIEILILDQAEIFLAQNWDHILHIVGHLHLKPQICRTRDYSRVRSWCLKDLSRFYRQTLIFTSHELPEFRALFENKCCNYRGKVNISNAVINGSIQKVMIKIPQIFYKISANSFQNSFDHRFKYFVNEILPKVKNLSVSHCMIYIPSYFDFVRIRNYFKMEAINFVQICEYTRPDKVTRARDVFYHRGSPFLLYSERYHFFQRSNIKGIRHLIMYQPPLWPNLYSEIINLMKNSNQNNQVHLMNFMSITILYTKYDVLQLNGIIGSENTLKLLKSNNPSHVFLHK